MYENARRYTDGKHAAQYIGTAEATLKSAADRAGTSVGVVRVLMQVAAMKATGAQVRALDLAEAGLGAATWINRELAEAKRLGWMESQRGNLHILSTGRKVVADVARAWDRSARRLTAFQDALPFRKRLAKRNADQA